MAARFKAIVLEKKDFGAGLGTEWKLALWADVPAARQTFYAAQNKTTCSVWIGAITGDHQAIQNGSVAETTTVIQQNPGQTLAQLQPVAQQAAADYQTAVTAYNPWTRYGTTWDGTTWVLASVS